MVSPNELEIYDEIEKELTEQNDIEEERRKRKKEKRYKIGRFRKWKKT